MLLTSGQAQALLAPERGGAIVSLNLGGVDILRPAAPDERDPLEMASFPLVPYANRIAHGRFRFGGRDYQLPLNFGDHPHAIHGVGWTAVWTGEQPAGDRAVLTHVHGGDDAWPWRYEAVQTIMLSEGSLDMTISVRNLADRAMPVGLGFHPYFLIDAQSSLQFDADRMWLADADMLPVQPAAADYLGDWSAGAPASGSMLVDHCYGGWAGTATIERGDGRSVTLTATGAPWLHVYRPPGQSFLCLEPVTHMPDAINRDAGMDVLIPGAERSLSIRIMVG